MSHTDHPVAGSANRLSTPEFIIMMATLIAMVAFSINSMLSSLPDIAQALSPDNVNRAQLVLTFFMLGMGGGTFFVGPISDAIGRKATIAGGGVIYLCGALLATHAQTLEALLIARLIQGLGASAPRIVSMALIRDLYAGREMARVTSFIMMIFILVPAMAPSLGAVIAHAAGWRGIFYAFMLFGCIGIGWLLLRQPETLPLSMRRPLRAGPLWSGLREVISDRMVLIYTLVLTLGFGQMFATLSSAQQLYAAYGVTKTFPLWFAAAALLGGVGSFMNTRLVVRVGMRRIVTSAYLMQVGVSGLMLALVLSGMPQSGWGFAVFYIYIISVVAMSGITFGNLNALAMQKMGHLAGMAASVITALSTLGAVMFAAPVGLAFNGTVLPLATATLCCSGLAAVLMIRFSRDTE